MEQIDSFYFVIGRGKKKSSVTTESQARRRRRTKPSKPRTHTEVDTSIPGLDNEVKLRRLRHRSESSTCLQQQLCQTPTQTVPPRFCTFRYSFSSRKNPNESQSLCCPFNAHVLPVYDISYWGCCIDFYCVYILYE